MAGNFAGLGKAYGRCRAPHHNNRGLHAQSSDRIPPRSKLKQVFLLIAVLVVLAALAGGYFAYWRYVAQQLEAGVEAWAAEQRALGNDVAFAWDGIGGFPLRFEATFRRPGDPLARPARGGDVDRRHAPCRDGTMEPAPDRGPLGRPPRCVAAPRRRPRRVARGRHRLRRRRSIFTTAALLRGFTLALQQPDITLPDSTALAGAAATVMLDQPETPPTDFNMPLARVALDLRGLALPPGTRLVTEDAVEALVLRRHHQGPDAAGAAEGRADCVAGCRRRG